MDKTTSVVLRQIGPCLCERAEEVDSPKFRYTCPHWCLFPSCFLLGQCKEHDLAMINQLLDDPKLTARKYREWKVMNTLLLQDIYYQQPAPQDPEDTPQELKNPSSPDCVEKSLWAEARTAPFLVPVPFYKTLPGHTFCLQGNPNPVPEASSLLHEDATRVKPVLMQWESWLPCVASIDIGVMEFIQAGVSSVLLLGAARSARL